MVPKLNILSMFCSHIWCAPLNLSYEAFQYLLGHLEYLIPNQTVVSASQGSDLYDANSSNVIVGRTPIIEFARYNVTPLARPNSRV